MHIERDLFNVVANEVKGKEVVILLGPRQVGKSYILAWLKKKVEKNNMNTSFFDLENKMGKKAHDYYLKFGGLPGVMNKRNKPDRMKHLQELMQAYLIKDIF